MAVRIISNEHDELEQRDWNSACFLNIFVRTLFYLTTHIHSLRRPDHVTAGSAALAAVTVHCRPVSTHFLSVCCCWYYFSTQRIQRSS